MSIQTGLERFDLRARPAIASISSSPNHSLTLGKAHVTIFVQRMYEDSSPQPRYPELQRNEDRIWSFKGSHQLGPGIRYVQGKVYDTRLLTYFEALSAFLTSMEIRDIFQLDSTSCVSFRVSVTHEMV